MLADRLAHVGVHLHHVAGCEIGLGIEQREGPLLLGQIDRGQIGRAGDGVHPDFGLPGCLGRAIAQAKHQKRVGKAGNAQTDAALVLRLGFLLGQGEAAGVNHIVHHPDRQAHQIIQRLGVKQGLGRERIADQRRKVHRAQKAGAIGRQGLLAAGVGGGDRLDIAQIVHRVDAVDEDHAGLGEVIGVAHDAVPQVARLHGLEDLAAELQFPRPISLHRIHERIGDKDRQVEHPQAGRVFLGLDEGLDVGMVAAHGGHHRAAARACRHDGAAHRIPDIHEGQGPRGIGGDAFHLGAARADG